jgi:hypothetical protein
MRVYPTSFFSVYLWEPGETDSLSTAASMQPTVPASDDVNVEHWLKWQLTGEIRNARIQI